MSTASGVVGRLQVFNTIAKQSFHFLRFKSMAPPTCLGFFFCFLLVLVLIVVVVVVFVCVFFLKRVRHTNSFSFENGYLFICFGLWSTLRRVFDIFKNALQSGCWQNLGHRVGHGLGPPYGPPKFNLILFFYHVYLEYCSGEFRTMIVRSEQCSTNTNS